MNKAELAAKVSLSLDTTSKAALAAVDAVFDTIGKTMSAGEEVNITGFGKFVPFETKGRTGRNPKTGETVDVPSKTVVKFRPGKTLKELVDVQPPF